MILSMLNAELSTVRGQTSALVESILLLLEKSTTLYI